MQTSSIGGAFYFKDSGILTVNSISVNYCYTCDKGAAFYIENANLVETGTSTYSYNAAI